MSLTLSCVWQGLAAHKDELGAPLCPCRHYDDKKAEVAQGFWNCPCVPMRERKVLAPAALLVPAAAHALCAYHSQYVHRSSMLCCPLSPFVGFQECHCMLFLTEDNGFRGDDRAISLEEIQETTKGMSGVQD